MRIVVEWKRKSVSAFLCDETAGSALTCCHISESLSQLSVLRPQERKNTRTCVGQMSCIMCLYLSIYLFFYSVMTSTVLCAVYWLLWLPKGMYCRWTGKTGLFCHCYPAWWEIAGIWFSTLKLKASLCLWWIQNVRFTIFNSFHLYFSPNFTQCQCFFWPSVILMLLLGCWIKTTMG